jgi:hypothetical protein
MVATQRGDERVKGKLILKWDMHTCFEDWLKDSLSTIDEKLNSIAIAKEAETQKFKLLDDSVLSEMKMDTNSVVGQKFSIEDYESIEEMLKRGRDTIKDYMAGKKQLSMYTQTGRGRVN